MSFSKKAKSELCEIEEIDNNKLNALVYGMVLFSKQFSSKSLYFTTESRPAAALYSELVSSLIGVITETSSRIIRRGGEQGLYTVSVPDSEDAGKVFDHFGHIDNTPSLRLNRSNINDDECLPYFLRGAFLVCGNVTDPGKDYHLEFVVPHMNLANDLCKIISETEIAPKGIKTICRKGNYIVYAKDSEGIADLLAYIGAKRAYFEILDAKIYKSVRNDANRRTNFDMANTKKTANAAVRQLKAIKIIRDAGALSGLSDDLRELAVLREAHPEYNLRELGEELSAPISRSGVNHRLARLIEIAADISGKPV